ncbi:MAG TPA: type II toxin-antitoxin system VapC family toxin [Ilumatobacteraceae bacterium]|nr:type II toxin-antitoxin system VapC family toxin [Ilumatobacteraceae bacterium]HRB05227.1 type II toxin-antitoxin system VapC family toxin [Ilumatobacteraceae bacterium]
MIRAVDTSVLVAAFASWHEDHALAVDELARKPLLIAHSMVETFSVLTRLPEPQRAAPVMVAEFFERNFPRDPLTLGASAARSVPGTLAGLGIVGGAAYDGLIALTARAGDATLVSLDQRAAPTYRRCGVPFELLGG